jgi:cytochrome c
MISGRKRSAFTFIWFLLMLPAAIRATDKSGINRPLDPWVFRSVLDKKPRMLTLALHPEMYVAYDLTTCTIYKIWKGGVSKDGAAYTDKKTIQPSSWGAAYFLDNQHQFSWHVEVGGQNRLAKIISKGYSFTNNQITLNYALILEPADTAWVAERPEFVTDRTGKPGLERVFYVKNLPAKAVVKLTSATKEIVLKPSGATRVRVFFDKLPAQQRPLLEEQFDHKGRYYMEKSDCFTCHELTEDNVGPSFEHIAQRYDPKQDVQRLTKKIKEGGSGAWGNTVMNPHPQLSDDELKTIVAYVFTLKPAQKTSATSTTNSASTKAQRPTRPGDGTALEGVHPSYTLTTLHRAGFHPRVGGLAFRPDGKLLVTTWDSVGGVYLLSGVATGDSSKIKIKRIAAGLAEPLGIDVVNRQIYVLQKHELTQLIDHNGDDVIDEYRAICNSWQVTADFHEFAFGLVYKDGFFYATLSMAMRLKPDEKQVPDRGRTIRISPDGHYDWVNYGLRTPNGIGLGVDNEIFITDNQGQWLPGNKLIHLRKGDYNGMGWAIPPDGKELPTMAPPTLWLPQNEIANSPSEPTLIKDGPYRGQMLHGDVTYGGIQRDFLEKVLGQYQGAVFRFSQGFAAGVNRLRWGPDDALYIGELGMEGGGWSWKERKFGLQRLQYNGQTTFEMLAVRAKPDGFEIDLTEPLKAGIELTLEDFQIQQWRYQPTASYGGPKLDLEDLTIKNIKLSDNRTRILLQIPNLKKEHVVYFRLSDRFQNQKGKPLWSTETWYTLNNIPEM